MCHNVVDRLDWDGICGGGRETNTIDFPEFSYPYCTTEWFNHGCHLRNVSNVWLHFGKRLLVQ